MPSGSAVTALLRCNTRLTGTGTTVASRCSANCSHADSVVRPPTPTYIVSSIFSTSPPSSVAGSVMATVRKPKPAMTSAAAATSPVRSGAPGRAITAVSPHSTMVSSMNTLSG